MAYGQKEALDTFFPSQTKVFSLSFVVESPENDLIEIMEALPKELSFSSLPRFEGEKRCVEIYLAHYDEALVRKWDLFFRNEALALGKKIKDC